MQAIILAGGLGTRLRSVINQQPKVLAPVAGKPFLYWLITYLQKQGVNNFVFSLGYLHEQVELFLMDEFPALNYQVVIEDEPLGTGGAIKLCLNFCNEEDIILANGDTFFELDIDAFYRNFIETSSNCSIALTPMQHFDRYGSVTITNENIITEFNEKRYCETGLINTGLVLFKKSVFEAKTSSVGNKFSFEKDFIEPNISNLKVTGFITGGYFIDIGIPEDYQKAQTELLSIFAHKF
ncbi:MAG: nucleotidyltransferase family protein [Flavobacterium sp.]|nr:nucleotidyltransferase family protein [Flavobacterium sp.]